MKKSILKVLLLTGLVVRLAVGMAQQNNYAEYRERAESNLKYLANDYHIKNRVLINTNGIILYKDDRKTMDLVLHWTDMHKFIDIIENWDYYEMVRVFGMKGTQAFQQQPKGMVSWYKEYPSEFEELRIALDPGHFGGNIDEANYEMRFAKFQAKDVGSTKDIEFYEADLASAVCYIVKDSIEAHNGRALLTREYALSAIGKPFKKWLKEDFQKDVEGSLKKGDVSKELYKILKDSATHERFIFDNYFKFLDFRARIAKINEFKANITFAVHFNAKEGNKRFGNRYLLPVEDNYNMAFVPGAFMANELEKVDQKVDFLRLLVSKDLENSMRIAKTLMDKHTEILKVPVIPVDNDINVLRDNSIPTDHEGVYSRNLALTRMVRGSVVYGESLYQDNIDELKKLSSKTVKLWIPDKGEVLVSQRCVEIANAYWQTIKATVLENRKLKTVAANSGN